MKNLQLTDKQHLYIWVLPPDVGAVWPLKPPRRGAGLGGGGWGLDSPSRNPTYWVQRGPKKEASEMGG